MTTARQYAFTEEDVKDPTQLAYLLNRLLSVTLSLKDTLDTIPDGVTFKKVTGVVAGQVTQTSIGNNAIGTPQLIANSVTAAKVAAHTLTADQIVVGIVGGNNEAQNSSMEDPSVSPPNLWVLYNNGPEAATLVLDATNAYHGTRSAKVSWSVPNTSTKGIFSATGNVVFKPNKTYVVSWYAKATSAIATTMDLHWNTNPASTVGLLTPNVSTAWQRFAYQITWGASVDINLFISITNAFAAAANDLYIDAVQVEEGTLLTAYSPKADELLTGQVTGVYIGNGAVTATKINVGQLSAITADMGTLTAGLIRDTNTKFKIDLANVLLTVVDNQGSPATRVKLGKTGAAATDYGIQIFDQSGNTIVDINGLGVNTVGTTQIVNTSVTSGKISVSQLSAIAADVGTLNAGKIQNAGATAGILLSGALPGGWTTYLDLTASGANPLLHHASLDLNANGTANFSGTVSASSFTAATATFKDITQNWGGGTNATLKQFELGGNEAIRVTATGIGGQITLWDSGSANHYVQWIAGGSIAAPTHNWLIGYATSQDLYVKYDFTDIVKFNSIGSVQFPNMGTTANGANANINNASSNQLLRSTSSLRYKTDVRALAPTGAGDLVTALSPIVFKSTASADDPEADFVGFAAEDVAAIDPRFVFLDAKGQPDGVQYDRLIVPVIAFVQQIDQRLSALEARLVA